MKQIVDKLNKIAKKIDESVEIPQTDLIIDSLDAITKAYGGTPNDSNLIVDKLEDIYNNISSAPSGNIEITENTEEGEPLDISQYATATVNVAGGGGSDVPMCKLTVLANGAGSVTAGTAENSVVIYDNLVEGSGVSISGDSVDVYSPYSYQNNTYIVTYFSRMGYPDEETALASVTNLNNISVIAYQNESLFWNIILAVTDPTLPSSATIPCEPK